jgi:RNA-directed DNA polymerase
MAKEASKSCREDAGMPGVSPVNTGDPDLEYAFYLAERRVLEIQAKLHRWARDDPHRRFDDLFNLAAPRKRLVISPVKPGGTQREVSGPDG